MIHFLNKRRAGSFLRLFSCLVALLAVSCITDDDLPTGEVYVQVGDTLPDFRVTLSDGAEFDTSTLGGSVSLIMFFDTSCPDCREMLPRVQQVYDSFRDQEGIRMAFISRAEDEASVASYWAEEGLTLPYYADPSRTIYSLFADATIPRIYISDAQRVVRFAHTDYPLPTARELAEEIGTLRASVTGAE